MIETYIQKGEAILVYTDISFADRIISIQQHLGSHADIVVFSEEKMKIDTVRDFVYEMQKGSTEGVYGVSKLGILICDDIALSAQHALLKVLEDIDSSTCVIVYTHSESVFMSTVLSRIIEISEVGKIKKSGLIITGKTVAERLESVKKIMKDFDDEKITKQDIIGILDMIKENTEVYTRSFSMLKQPSVSVKYVLEYVASNL